jgi:hypothetical protein
MMGSTRFVRKADEGGWEVIKEGHRRATAGGATKADAMRAAERLVRQEGGGEVQIHNRTGKIVEANTIRSKRSTR